MGRFTGFALWKWKGEAPIAHEGSYKEVINPWFCSYCSPILLLLAAFKSPTQPCFMQERLSSIQQHNSIEAKRILQSQKRSLNSYWTSQKKKKILQTIILILIRQSKLQQISYLNGHRIKNLETKTESLGNIIWGNRV